MELKTLLIELVERDGSDLHLVVGQPPIFRVHGSLVRCDGPILDAAAMEAVLLPPLNERRREMVMQEGEDIALALRHAGHVFRYYVFPDRGRLAAVIRRALHEAPTIDELFPGHGEGVNRALHEIIQLPSGLVFVTGSGGSGKTTTCVAMLETLNRTAARRILTVEAPVSYDLESKQSFITQRSVGEDVESFAQGLLSAVHEDFDVILIEEMRDLETTQYAFALAETGHLVFATLHTMDTQQTVERLIDVFEVNQQPQIRRMLSRSLEAIISQQLMPRADRPGRVAANEILLATPQIRQMIADGETDFSPAIEASRDQGMQTMDDCLLQLYRDGVIGQATASSRLKDRSRLAAMPDA